ncbi:MAG: SET domain-containing protein-lysine N-methyltransferase [Alphaproteobacteria bacterium HGW-Alphaproteobacteria-3]|jgi:hypothetical protein|nr:MAG: SET domain-containing protein-lysine N-methyltransferase [Gammaproteobacteria bacterium HGW-Gammaproteobacteria-2]PKP76080.1 MAG: SET domain-containing protein-lysine N-methyltransferase [Alphaproteobacteria bacterium HGW-Alphaproteobacteria-3]
MLLIDTIVRSSTYGLGLFTTQPLRAGCCVWRWHSLTEVVVPPGPHPAPFAEFLSHFGYLAEGIGIVVNLDNARYMNHSDTPNLVERDGCNYAARDIAAGEELTCDYRVFDCGLTLSGAFLKR